MARSRSSVPKVVARWSLGRTLVTGLDGCVAVNNSSRSTEIVRLLKYGREMDLDVRSLPDPGKDEPTARDGGQISIWLAEEIRTKIRQESRAARLTSSEYVRRLLTYAFDHGLEKYSPEVMYAFAAKVLDHLTTDLQSTAELGAKVFPPNDLKEPLPWGGGNPLLRLALGILLRRGQAENYGSRWVRTIRP